MVSTLSFARTTTLICGADTGLPLSDGSPASSRIPGCCVDMLPPGQAPWGQAAVPLPQTSEARMAEFRTTVAVGVGWTAAQKWLVRLSGVLTFVVLSRLLGPADIGLVALALAFLGVQALNAVTGNLDRAGGALVPSRAVKFATLARLLGRVRPPRPSRRPGGPSPTPSGPGASWVDLSRGSDAAQPVKRAAAFFTVS